MPCQSKINSKKLSQTWKTKVSYVITTQKRWNIQFNNAPSFTDYGTHGIMTPILQGLRDIISMLISYLYWNLRML